MDKPPFISKLKLKNYKNIVIEDDLRFNNLSILIGPNGCGKSNLIGIFRFLKDCLTDPTEIQETTSFEEAIRNLGGEKILDRIVKIPTDVLFGFEFYAFRRNIYLDIGVSISNIYDFIVISKESLDNRKSDFGDEGVLYSAHNSKTCEGFVLLDNSEKFELKIIPHNQLLLKYLPRLVENIKISDDITKFYNFRRYLIETISKWHFYNANYMDINEIRLSEPKLRTGDIFLSANCENLARVIYNLFQKDVDFDEKLNQSIKQILPMTKKVRAIHAGELSLTVEWHIDGMKEPFYLYEMSDGMVRMLCWAVMLHSPRLPSLLVIEEPEIGIHPAWMSVLAEWIKSASERTQVIISTHSPDLLDHFTERLEDVICFRFDGKSHFFPKNLIREEVAAKLEEGWQLGDLYRIGHPFIGGWPW